jgi:hypothetical protein
MSGSLKHNERRAVITDSRIIFTHVRALFANTIRESRCAVIA